MTEIFVSLITGSILTLFGVFAGFYFQKRLDKGKEKEKIRFEIYMSLMDIHSYYFWITTAELHNENPSQEIVNSLRILSLKISDKLRQVDEIEYLDETLDILFSEKIATAKERAKRLNELLSKLDKLVSPRFMKKMKQISNDNIAIMVSKSISKFNAPGALKL